MRRQGEKRVVRASNPGFARVVSLSWLNQFRSDPLKCSVTLKDGSVPQ